MFYAKSDTGERISAERAVEEGIRAGLSCPVCDFPVVLRNGTQRICHFAHRKGADCDSFTADMSEWHLDWQKRFPEECREIVLEGQNELGDIEKHRADVLYHDVVVEFQHSPISEIEFWRRNYFYTRVAKHLLWVFTPSGWISGWKGDWDNNPLDVSLSWDKPSGPFRRFVPQKEPRITIGLQYPPVLNELTPGRGLSNGNSGADAPWPVAEGAEYDHPFKRFKIRLTSNRTFPIGQGYTPALRPDLRGVGGKYATGAASVQAKTRRLRGRPGLRLGSAGAAGASPSAASILPVDGLVLTGIQSPSSPIRIFLQRRSRDMMRE